MKTNRYLLLRLTISLVILFTGIRSALAEGMEESPLSSTTTLTTNAPSRFSQRFDFYSETTSRPGQNTIVHQSRLRSHFGLRQENLENFSIYVGVGLDRELGAPEQQWIQNSWRPQVGLSWQPFTFANTWIEYNRRYYALTNDRDWTQEQDDARAGFALSHNLSLIQQDKHSVQIENYAEGVSYFRVNREPVFSAHTRPVYQFFIDQNISVDPYAELYFQRSPALDLGINTNQARSGLRLKYQGTSYSASLFGYWPKEIGQNKDDDGHFVGLFVFGGTF